MRTGRLPLRALADLILPQSAHGLRLKSNTGRQLWLGSRTTTDLLCSTSVHRPTTALLPHLIRGFAAAAEATAPADEQPASVQPSTTFVYEAPLSKAVKRLKKLSIFSCAATVAGAPVLVFLGPDASSLMAKASVAFTLCSFGVFSTGLLHWFTGPYVHRLSHDKGASTVDVTTISMLAQPVQRSLRLDQMKTPDTLRPQATFEVDGNIFYVDSTNFADKELLAKLSKVGEPLS